MFAPYDYRREIVTQSDSAKLFYTAINSIAAYVLAYLLAHTIHLFGTALISVGFFYIKTVLYYHRIDYRINAAAWTRQAVLGVFSAGPLLCLVLAGIFYRIYLFTKKSPSWAKTFFLWLYLHCFNLFFGAYVAGVITLTGFRYVTNYLTVPRNAEYILALVCVIFMFAFGYFATRYFLQTAVSQSLIQRFSRPYFVFCAVILPWMLGSAVLVAIKMPLIITNLTEMIIYLMMFTIVVPVVIVQRNFQEVNLVRRTAQVGVSWPMVLATIGALAVYRILLADGLVIGAWIRNST